MADGMDRGLAIRLGIPPQSEQCLRCGTLRGTQQCGFFYGRFNAANWRCSTLGALQQLAQLQEQTSVHQGVVNAVVTHPRWIDGYALLTWKDGEPQRVMSALWFDTDGKTSLLTVAEAERLLEAV